MAGSLLAVKAEEILRKIEEGKPVEYENVLIFGDLDLCRLDLPSDEGMGKVVSSIIKIEYSIIKGDVFFDRSTFSNLVDFDGTIFTKVANFSESQFCDDAGFSEAQFQGDANFYRARFKTEANFSRTRFSGDADFRSVAFYKNLNLDSAKGSVIRFSDVTFGDGSYVYFRDLDFNKIAVRWDPLQDHLPYDGSVYLSLVKNFRNLEQFDDADNCYYKYREEKKARAVSCRARVIDSLACISCGYGVRPSNAVFLSLGTIILFTLIFWASKAIVQDGSAGVDPGDQGLIISIRDSLYFSSMVFIGRTPVHMYTYGNFLYLTVVETLMGWMLMALFLVTLGKVMLR